MYENIIYWGKQPKKPPKKQKTTPVHSDLSDAWSSGYLIHTKLYIN